MGPSIAIFPFQPDDHSAMMPAVSPLRGPRQRFGAGGAGVERWAAGADRSRPDRRGSTVPWPLARPDPAHERNCVVDALPPATLQRRNHGGPGTRLSHHQYLLGGLDVFEGADADRANFQVRLDAARAILEREQ